MRKSVVRPTRPSPWRHHRVAHVAAAAGLVALWLALWGSVSGLAIVTGIVLAVVVLIVFPLPPMTLHYHPRPWPIIVVISRFIFDVIVAAIHVSYLAVRPQPPATDVVVARLATDSDLIQHLTALAVSLVPGSLIIAADADNRTLTIHVLYSSPRPPAVFLGSVIAQESRIAAALGYPHPTASRSRGGAS